MSEASVPTVLVVAVALIDPDGRVLIARRAAAEAVGRVIGDRLRGFAEASSI